MSKSHKLFPFFFPDGMDNQEKFSERLSPIVSDRSSLLGMDHSVWHGPIRLFNRAWHPLMHFFCISAAFLLHFFCISFTFLLIFSAVLS